MTYLRRHIDERLARLMDVHPACLVEGIRGVGKTSSAQRLAASTLRLDDPPIAAMVTADPEAAFGALQPPVLIDEWQRSPTVWDAVRRSIDNDRAPGRFILSGSSRAALAADVHAGAGRILPVRLRPMTLCERRGEAPPASLADLAEFGIDAVRGARSPLRPSEQADAATESGLPGYLALDPADHQEALRAYLDLAVARDLAEITSAQRDVTKLRNYVRAYGATVATTAEHAAIHNAAGVSKATGESYHDLLTRLGLVEELPGWSNNRLKRLTRRPKRHLIDPALAAADHHDTASVLAQRPDRAGHLFESAVVSQIRAAADALGLGWRFSHLRTAGGDHEVDLIADLPGGEVLAFEAKLSPTVTPADARHLATLKERLGASFRAGLVIHPGETAYRLHDRIAAVPLAALV